MRGSRSYDRVRVRVRVRGREGCGVGSFGRGNVLIEGNKVKSVEE